MISSVLASDLSRMLYELRDVIELVVSCSRYVWEKRITPECLSQDCAKEASLKSKSVKPVGEVDSEEEENEALQDQNELDWHVNWVFKVLKAIKKR